MALKRQSQGAIWTDHVLERLGKRRLLQETAAFAFRSPDRTIRKKNGVVEFQKDIEKHRISVAAKRNERGEWIVLSAWSDPPQLDTGEQTKKEKRNYQRLSEWKKLLFLLRKQLGW